MDRTEPEAAAALKPKQARFVAEYLVDLNATQAAIRAGYSPKTAKAQGSRLLTNVDVRSAIDASTAKRADKVGITADYVLSSLKEVVERCMERAPVMVREGREMVQKVDDEGHNVWEFDSSGANRGLELLGKHLKLFTEKHEHAGPGGGPVVFSFPPIPADDEP